MKKFLFFLLLVAAGVFAYFWYIRGVNLFKRTEDYPLPQYGANVNGSNGNVNAPAKPPLQTITAYQWKSAAPMPTPRSSMAVATIGSHIYVIGGMGDLARPTGVMEMYDTQS